MKNIEEKILDLINNSDGLTIGDVARILNIHRITASKYLAVLEAKNKIRYRAVGKAKLYFSR